ncbi:uncharacterized protein ACRADG_001805 [Cochliomyia hominivorax]
MNIEKILIICIAFTILAYAQAKSIASIEPNAEKPVELPKPESYTATTISPYEIKQSEDIIEIDEEVLQTTISPLENTTERPIFDTVAKENPENQEQPKESETVKKDKPKPVKKPATFGELSVFYVDQDGNEVNYDKNLYYCENCDEENNPDDNNEDFFYVTEEENLDFNGNGEFIPRKEFIEDIDIDNVEDYENEGDNDDEEEENDGIKEDDIEEEEVNDGNEDANDDDFEDNNDEYANNDEDYLEEEPQFDDENDEILYDDEEDLEF